ncbi:MAG: DUF4185 domain-containing protein [Chthonomonadales bacterium]
MKNSFVLSVCIIASVALSDRVSGQAKITVEKVENRGLLFTDNPAGVNGTDAGYSLPIGNKTLWFFGDVFLLSPMAAHKDVVGDLSNCGLLVSSGKGVTPLSKYQFITDPAIGLARALLPNRAGESKNIRIWPFGSWYDATAKRIYLYYGRVNTTGGGPLDFKWEGNGLAVADAPNLDDLHFERLPSSIKEDLWWRDSAKSPVYGSAIVTERSSDYIYLVGIDTKNHGRASRMARVSKSKISDSSAYEYMTGSSYGPKWSTNRDHAVPVAGLDDFPTELSIHWNDYVGGYLAVHSMGISDRIRISVAPNPWGPYTTISEISAPHRVLGKGFCYAGKEHPELSEDGGRVIYVTYVDSERYWLHMLKVTLKK